MTPNAGVRSVRRLASFGIFLGLLNLVWEAVQMVLIYWR